MGEGLYEWRRPHRGLRDNVKGVFFAVACAALAAGVVVAVRQWTSGNARSVVEILMLIGAVGLPAVLVLATGLLSLELDQRVVIDTRSRMIHITRPYTARGPWLGFPRRMSIAFAAVASCTYRGEIRRRRDHPPLEELVLEVRGVGVTSVRLRCLDGSGLAEVADRVRAATGVGASDERLRRDRAVEIWVAVAIGAVGVAAAVLAKLGYLVP